MKISAANVQHAYARLAPRERLFVQAGAVAFVLFVLAMVVYQFRDAKESARSRIREREKQIEQLLALRGTYQQLRSETAALVTPPDPNRSENWLYSTLDPIVAKTVSREKVSKMAPSSKDVGDQYREDSLEIVLAGVTLQQVVALLWEVERSAMPLHVGRLDLKKRLNDPYQFDVTLNVSSVSSKNA